MKYFDELLKIQYPDGFGGFVEMPDLMVRYTFTDEVLSTKTAFYEYTWKDGDRPDRVAKLYYGSYDYAWLVLMSGQLFDWLGDLPIEEHFFVEYLENKYGMPIEQIHSTVHHYEDPDGWIVDQYQNGTPVSLYDYEDSLNDKKRNVKLISKIYLKEIRKEFRQKLQDLRNSRES